MQHLRLDVRAVSGGGRIRVGCGALDRSRLEPRAQRACILILLLCSLATRLQPGPASQHALKGCRAGASESGPPCRMRQTRTLEAAWRYSASSSRRTRSGSRSPAPWSSCAWRATW